MNSLTELRLEKEYPNRCPHWTLKSFSKRASQGYCTLHNSGVDWTNSEQCQRYYKTNNPHPNCPIKLPKEQNQ